MTYTRHSWTLSNDVSLAYHTYCNTGHQFIIVISDDTHAYTNCFNDLGLLHSAEMRTRAPNLPFAPSKANALTDCPAAAAWYVVKLSSFGINIIDTLISALYELQTLATDKTIDRLPIYLSPSFLQNF